MRQQTSRRAIVAAVLVAAVVWAASGETPLAQGNSGRKGGGDGGGGRSSCVWPETPLVSENVAVAGTVIVQPVHAGSNMFGRPLAAEPFVSGPNKVRFAVGASTDGGPGYVHVYDFDGGSVVSLVRSINVGDAQDMDAPRRLAVAYVDADPGPDFVVGGHGGYPRIYTSASDYTEAVILGVDEDRDGLLDPWPDNFGTESVSAVGAVVAVGAPGGLETRGDGAVAIYDLTGIPDGPSIVSPSVTVSDPADQFGYAVGLGYFTGADAALDLLVGAPSYGDKKSAGEATFVPDVLAGGTLAAQFLADGDHTKDAFGRQVTVVGGRLLVVGGGGDRRVEVFEGLSLGPSLRPGGHANFSIGWGSSGVAVGDVDGDGFDDDAIVGAPHGYCTDAGGGAGSDAQPGRAYLFLDYASGTGPDSTFEVTDPSPSSKAYAWNVFGWNTAIVSDGTDGSWVFIGEPGRDGDILDLPATENEGRVYIYRITGLR